MVNDIRVYSSSLTLSDWLIFFFTDFILGSDFRWELNSIVLNMIKNDFCYLQLLFIAKYSKWIYINIWDSVELLMNKADLYQL